MWVNGVSAEPIWLSNRPTSKQTVKMRTRAPGNDSWARMLQSSGLVLCNPCHTCSAKPRLAHANQKFPDQPKPWRTRNPNRPLLRNPPATSLSLLSKASLPRLASIGHARPYALLTFRLAKDCVGDAHSDRTDPILPNDSVRADVCAFFSNLEGPSVDGQLPCPPQGVCCQPR